MSFVDYGNHSVVTLNQMRMIDATLMTIPKHAIKCKLAGKFRDGFKDPLLFLSQLFI